MIVIKCISHKMLVYVFILTYSQQVIYYYAFEDFIITLHHHVLSKQKIFTDDCVSFWWKYILMKSLHNSCSKSSIGYATRVPFWNYIRMERGHCLSKLKHCLIIYYFPIWKRQRPYSLRHAVLLHFNITVMTSDTLKSCCFLILKSSFQIIK